MQVRGLEPLILLGQSVIFSCVFIPPHSHNWCLERDSNSQSLRRQILSLLCIPFHHQGNKTLILVREEGFEPSRLSATDFKSVMCYQFHHSRIQISELLLKSSQIWCIRRDLNPQSLRRQFLRLLCIPIPPLMHK